MASNSMETQDATALALADGGERSRASPSRTSPSKAEVDDASTKQEPSDNTVPLDVTGKRLEKSYSPSN
jgi:hypothetical protein